MVSFVKETERNISWKNRKNLKGTGIILKEDLPLPIEQTMKKLLPYHKEARKQNVKSNLIRDHIYIDGVRYTEADLDKIPKHPQPTRTCYKEDEKHYFFWGKDCVLSNFHGCEFSENEKFFNSVEQYYTYHKAAFFEDEIANTQIMAATDPMYMKRLQIKGYKVERVETCLIKGDGERHCTPI